MGEQTPGRAWLVGAGPGDPGLVTLRAVEVLRRADVVLYDRLANGELLDHAPASAERIYVGKMPGRHALTQDEINAELVQRVRDGKSVVRLKGGDPFVFGRGGEEAAALAAAALPFEIVPGVTSAIAGPAYAGIPVTDRSVASSFAVVTGHEEPGRDEPRVDWNALATGPDTLVVLMGVGNLARIADRLITGGRRPSTPVAVVESATTPRQRTVTGTLATIAEIALEQQVNAPAVMVIGEVVGLRKRLQWFESRPLFGKSVLVTRTRKQASVLRRMLEERGADVVELPAIEIVETAPFELTARIAQALANGEYGWTVFTSANGVNLFFDRLRQHGYDARAFHGCNVCAIGPGTAAALRERGIVADLVPSRYVAEGVLKSMSAHDLNRRRVLVPRAENARPELIAGLRRLGAEVEDIPLYVSRPPARSDDAALDRVRRGDIDVLTFASSSTVAHLVDMLGGDIEPLQRPIVACIGPVTAGTAARLGLRVDMTADEYSVPGLVAALERHFSTDEQRPNGRSKSDA